MTFRGIRILTFGWFALLILFSQVVLPLSGSDEIFPFFDWELFSGDVREHQDFVVLVESCKNQPILPPCDVVQCGRPMKARRDSLYGIVQEFGFSVVTRNTNQNQLRAILERRAFRPGMKCRYTLAIRRADAAALVRGQAKPKLEPIYVYEQADAKD